MLHRREVLAGFGAAAILMPEMGSTAVRSPLPTEGVRLSYSVFYGESRIGQHDVLIREHDEADHVVIQHALSAEVRVFFAVAYSLEHRSTEIWRGSELRSIRSETVENDERFLTEAEPIDEGMFLRSERHEVIVPHGAVSSDSFWLAASLKAPAIVNVRSGEVAIPTIRKRNDGRFEFSAKFPHGSIEAELLFDGEFLREARTESGGHEVVFRREQV